MNVRVGDAAGRLAWFSFGTTLVLSPFRVEVAPDVAWSAVAIGATLVFWIVSLLAAPRRIDLGPRFVALPVSGLLAVAWLGVPLSLDPARSLHGAIELALVVGLGMYALNEVRRVDRLVLPLMALITVQVIVALGQVASQGSLGLAFLGEHRLDPAEGGISVVATTDGTRWLRAYGLTDHSNILGGILAIALVLLASILAWGRGAWRRSEPGGDWGASRVAFLIVYGLGVVTLLATFSRGAWLAFAIGLVVAVTMAAQMRDRSAVRRSLGLAGIAAAVFLVFLVPFAPYVAARTGLSGPVGTEQRSIDERQALTGAAIDVFLEHPLLGSGLRTVPQAMRATAPDFPYPYDAAHVVLVEAAAETGIAGFLCYLAILVGPWVAVARSRGRWTPALVATSATLASVTVVGLFDHYPWTSPSGRIWAWTALGLWVLAYGAIRGGRLPERQRG